MIDSPDKYEAERLSKVERLEQRGHDPWGQRFPDRDWIGTVRDQWVEGTEHGEGPQVRVAGRIMSRRSQGKVRFLDLQDWTGRIQLFVGKKQVGEEDWAVCDLLDLGDLIGIDGELGKTRSGELTVFAKKVHFLTKCLTPPPEKWHGLQDKELRYRQRYLDLAYNPDVLQTFLARSKMVTYIRQFLTGREFLEVETPTLHAIAGGAAARPFITQHNALHMELYLRIALELHLKRLMVGGVERVFELGRVFRNEGVSTRHNPEFTMLELYQAYGNYEDMMELTESLVVGLVDLIEERGENPNSSTSDAAETDCGSSAARSRQLGDKELDFSPPWPRQSYAELLEEHTGAVLNDPESLRQAADRHEIEVGNKHPDVLANELFEECVEDRLDGPVFVIDYPASLCPLTKRKRENPDVAERFELFIGGMEVANAYTELNDPVLQQQLFQQQLEGLAEEDSMARMDTDFIRALKNGMPPAGGLGIGIDRLVMLLTNSASIRDVILFPLLRHSDTTSES